MHNLILATSPYVLASFVGYLALMLAIGAVFSGKVKDMNDYYLGGRKMNKWVVALSAQASDMSGWMLMGLPGAVYVGGFSEAWIGIGLVIGTYLNWKIVAKRLRVYSHACRDSITIPDFLTNRFRDPTGFVGLIAAAIILVFFTVYVASGFVSCAKLFVSTFNVPDVGPLSAYHFSLIVGAAVIVAYTFLGGYMAVCWTDFIQGSLMFLAVVLVPAIVMQRAGGFSGTVEELNAVNSNLLNIFTNASTGRAMTLFGGAGLVSGLAWGLGYFGMPHILVRFMSIGNPAEVKGARRIAMAWVVISLFAAVFGIGMLGHLYLKQRGLDIADVGGDPEKIFMVMVNGIFDGGPLSKLTAGVLLSAIMAAIMSTADSQLLVSASAFSNDLYKRVIHRGASDRELVLVSRVAVAAVAVVALVLASMNNTEFAKRVMSMVSFAWAGFGAAFGPAIVLALFWRRTTLAGASAGMVVGAVSVFVWKFAVAPLADRGGPSFCGVYELAPAFFFSLVAIVVVSLLTKPPAKEILDEFDGVGNANGGE